MARPSEYSFEIANEVCEAIATTPRGLDFICNSNDKFPCARTFNDWLKKHDTELLPTYLRARERQADLIFDECLEIADNTDEDTITVKRAGYTQEVMDKEWVLRSKLRVETRLRMAGKLHPKKYGDRMIHAGDPDAPLGVISVPAKTDAGALVPDAPKIEKIQ